MAALRLDFSAGSCSSNTKLYCLRKRSALYAPLRGSKRGSLPTLQHCIRAGTCYNCQFLAVRTSCLPACLPAYQHAMFSMSAEQHL